MKKERAKTGRRSDKNFSINQLSLILNKRVNFVSHKELKHLLGARAKVSRSAYWQILKTFKELGVIDVINPRGVHFKKKVKGK